MSTPKSKKSSPAKKAANTTTVRRRGRSPNAPIRKRIVRIKIATNRPVGDRSGDMDRILITANPATIAPAAPIVVNNILTHELSLAFNPNTLEFSAIRDDEEYENVPYVIDGRRDILMTAKPDGKIECKIGVTLKANAANPNPPELTAVGDEEEYSNVSYVIDSFGDIVMIPKPDEKIECQIVLMLKANAIP